MRILICNTFLYRRGGAETYTLALAQLLREHGHEVLFFAMDHPQNQPSEQQQYFVEYIDYPTLRREQRLGNVWKVLSRSVYYRGARSQLRALLADLKPDIAHLQNIHANLTPSIIAELNAARVPIVWTLHDFKLLCPENSFFSNGTICEKCRGGRFYNCAVNRCKKGSLAASAVAGIEAYVHGAFGWCRRVDRFIAPSLFLQKKFEEFGWTEPRVEFVRNFLPSLGEAHPGGVGYGVFTGMLRPEKGVKTLLQALALAGNPRFYIAGDGPLRAELMAVAAGLELTNTEFLGHLDRAALDRLVRDASFAVVPSEWYENCPYAMLEAMAGGKALIASNLGGMAELVQHDVTGLTFPPRDAAALAAAIQRLGSDSALAVRLGSAARQFAERELTGAAHYGALRAVYDDVLGARTPAALRRVAVSSS